MAAEDLRQKDSRYYESWGKRLGNYIGVSFLKLLSLLPFWIMYGISDVLYFLFRYVIKYRVKVVEENLNHAFPEKSTEEIQTISKKYFRHMCDLFLEGIKLHSMSAKQIEKRLSFKGLELFQENYDQGKSVIVLAMHHNNWEWCSYIARYVPHLPLMVYNPIRGNLAMERFLEQSRCKWGGEHVPVNRTAKTAVSYMAKEKKIILWLAADQTPAASSKFWTMFLNREAPFFTGPEKIAKRANMPILFQHVKKLGRGKYEASVSMLIEDPSKLSPEEILLTYVKKMEEVIREEPEYYLWSHRRWKHTRPEGIELTI